MKENKIKQRFNNIPSIPNKDETITQNSWLDKLKPSRKNSIIKEKIFSKISEANSSIILDKDKKKPNKVKDILIGNIQ